MFNFASEIWQKRLNYEATTAHKARASAPGGAFATSCNVLNHRNLLTNLYYHMQKKILASLLVTPLAFNAMADITVNDGLQAETGWTQTGITGSTSVFTDNGVNCPIAGGYIQRTLNLLPGNYKLTFTDATGVQVKIGNKVVTGTDGVYNFTVDGNAAKDVTLVVESAANNGFSFSTLKLELVFDFETAAEALTAQLPALTALDNEESSLTDDYTKLATEKSAIEAAIATLNGNDQIKAYGDQKMWLYPEGDAISVRIKALIEAAKTYNKAAAEDNKAYYIETTNKANYDFFKSEITRLHEELDKINAAIDKAQEGLSADVNAYVDEQQAAKTADMKDVIAECEAYFKSVFEGATTLVDKAEVEEKYNELKKPLSDYDNNILWSQDQVYKTWIADATAYYKLMAELGTEEEPGLIKNAYDKDLSQLIALKGIEGYDGKYVNAFTEVSTGWQSELADEKAKAEEAATTATAGGIEGCAAKYDAAAATLAAAKEAMDTLVATAKAKVEEQNPLMESALKTIAGLEVPESVPASIKDEVAKVAGDIAALKTSVENAYSKLELPVDGFDTSVNEIQDKLAAIQPIIDLQKQYDTLKEYIAKNVDTVDIISGAFKGTMESIAASLGTLKLDSPEDFKKEISDALTLTDTNAKNLVKAQQDALKALEARKTAIDNMGTEAGKISFIEGAVKPTLGTVADEYYNTPLATYNSVKGSEAQKAYTELTALAEALTNSDEAFTGSVADILATYATAAEAANKAVVSAKYTAVEKAAEGEYYGDSDVATRLAAIKTALDNIATTVAATEKDIPAAANKIYDELNKVLGDLNGLDSDITQYKSNQNWATAQNDALADIADLIAAAQDTNDNTSWDQALSHFNEVINDFTTQAGTLTDDVETALKKGIDKGNITTADRKAIEEKIEALEKSVKDTTAQIKDNQGAYTGLLEDAESTRKDIQDVIDGLQKLIDEGGNPDEAKTGAWFKDLADTMDSLTVVNRELGDVYGQGIAGTKKSELSEKYQDLRNKADNIQNQIDTEYGNLVATANSAWMEIWKGRYDILRADYVNSIDTFNGYSSATLTNSEYFKYLKENVVVNVDGEDKKVLGDHEPIYKYSALITELNTKVTDFINAQNAAKKVISEEEFNEQAANSYSADMQALVDAMKEAAAQVANTYYNTIIAKAQATVNAAKDEMQQAGVSANIIDEYTEEAQQRIAMQDKFLGSSSDVVIAVNHIANDLEYLKIDTTAAAKAEWAQAWGDDTKELGMMADEIAGFEYVEKDEEIEVFNDAKAAVDAMTTPAALADLKDALTGLNEQMEAARKAFNSLKTKNQAAADADTTTADLEAEVGKLRVENNKLEEFADGVAATPGNSNIASDINDIANAIAASKDIVKDEPAIRTSIDNVQSDIDNGYTSLVANENAILNGLMSQIRLAYNNARAKDKFGSEAEEIAKNEEIDALQAAVEKLYNDNKDSVSDSYKADAIALEKKLTDELVNLQSLVSDDTALTDVLTALDELYTDTYTAVEAGKAAVGELVKDEYEPQYQELLDKLEGIKSAIEADGNQVLLHKDSFESQIKAVADELESLNTKAVAAQEDAANKAAIEAATKANAEALTAELDAAKAALEAAKEKVAAWGVAEWGVYLNGLDSRIAKIGEAIAQESTISEENPDGITEAEKTELSDAIADLSTEMDYYVLMGAQTYAENANQATKAAVTDARKALVDAGSVINSSEIGKKISQQATALETLYNETSAAVEAAEDDAARIAAYENFVEGTKAIQEALEAIREEIVENTYVIGDVNGNGGEPNTADLQLLFNWIGEGLSLEQIKEEHGAAIAAAADVNGSGELNIADGTALIQIISNESSASTRRIIARHGVIESDNVFGLVRSGEEEGNRLYSLFLNNSSSFIGAQVDIQLPIGMTLLDARLSGRAAGHEVQIYDNGGGNYRLVIFSMANAAFEGNSGELVELTIEGIGNPVATDMILADPTHTAVQGKTADTTMLDSIMESAHNVKERIYNAAGQSLRAVQRGINIIRRSDGTTSKEMHK